MRIEDVHPLAKCPKRKICDFSPIIDQPGLLVEQCEYCGKKVDYNRDEETGRLDNARYRQINIRKFVQPVGDTRGIFEWMYGTDPIKKTQRWHADKVKAKKAQDDLAIEGREYAKHLYANRHKM